MGRSTGKASIHVSNNTTRKPQLGATHESAGHAVRQRQDIHWRTHKPPPRSAGSHPRENRTADGCFKAALEGRSRTATIIYTGRQTFCPPGRPSPRLGVHTFREVQAWPLQRTRNPHLRQKWKQPICNLRTSEATGSRPIYGAKANTEYLGVGTVQQRGRWLFPTFSRLA